MHKLIHLERYESSSYSKLSLEFAHYALQTFLRIINLHIFNGAHRVVVYLGGCIEEGDQVMGVRLVGQGFLINRGWREGLRHEVLFILSKDPLNCGFKPFEELELDFHHSLELDVNVELGIINFLEVFLKRNGNESLSLWGEGVRKVLSHAKSVMTLL